MTTVFLAAINLGALLIYHLILRLIDEQDKLRELETKNHQLTLQQLQYDNLQDLVQKGDVGQLSSYLDQYQSSLPNDGRIQFCKNNTINLLLLYFAQQAKDNSIDYDVKVSFPEEIGIPPADLSVLLGNLLENAVHGCESVPEVQQKITVRGKTDRGSLFLSITNPYHGPLKQSANGRFQTTKKKGSGLGLHSVRTITERYHGVLEIDPKDNIFCVSVMLNTSVSVST